LLLGNTKCIHPMIILLMGYQKIGYSKINQLQL
jgi:hypothetical protein